MNTVLKGAAAISILAIFAISASAQGQSPAGQGGPPVLAKDLAPARLSTRLQVTSPAFSSGGTIDERYTQNGANHIHSVWRDIDNDWGMDFLAAHLEVEHPRA